MITGKKYDVLHWIAQVLLPTLGVLYFIGVGLWDWSNGESVLGAILIVDMLLGGVLWVSQVAYTQHIGQGDLLVEEDPHTGTQGLRLALDNTPEELVAKREVRFKVKKERPEVPG